ncbi:tetratricopeptide repeat protein, partial [Acinetobacter baumannii]
AAYWLRQAAEQGLPDAEYSMGICYIKGRGVPQSVDEGLIWLAKAAEHGHFMAKVLIKNPEKVESTLATLQEQSPAKRPEL